MRAVSATSGSEPAADAVRASRQGVPPRANPFAMSRVDRLAWRPGVVGVDLAVLLERWTALGRRGAVVAPEGHGKSTLLDALEAELARRGSLPRRLAVHPDRPFHATELARFLAGLDSRHVLLVDGAGHLPAWRWWRIRRAARRATGLLVAVHRPGLLPTLHRCTTTPELLQELVDVLLDGSQPPIPLPPAADLHARHAGNLRDALAELYDRCAGRWVGT